MFRWVNGWPESLSPFLKFFSVATNLIAVKIALALLLIGLIVAGGKARLAAILAMVAWPIANGMTDLFKHLVPHPRPFQELVGVSLRVGWTDSMGTASAHSANMAAIATVLAWYLRPWGSLWIVIAVLTGISRVYCGAHYPSQTLLGYACGIAAAAVVIAIYESVVRRIRPRELEEPAT